MFSKSVSALSAISWALMYWLLKIHVFPHSGFCCYELPSQPSGTFSYSSQCVNADGKQCAAIVEHIGGHLKVFSLWHHDQWALFTALSYLPERNWAGDHHAKRKNGSRWMCPRSDAEHHCVLCPEWEEIRLDRFLLFQSESSLSCSWR